VERLIHGKTASYNTLPVWDYKQLTTVFGPEHPSKYYGPIKTCDELEQLLESDDLQNPGACFQVCERCLASTKSLRISAANVVYSWSSSYSASSMRLRPLARSRPLSRPSTRSTRQRRMAHRWVARASRLGRTVMMMAEDDAHEAKIRRQDTVNTEDRGSCSAGRIGCRRLLQAYILLLIQLHLKIPLLPMEMFRYM